MALTATANRQAVEDIISRLNIQRCHRFTSSFNRSNLFYEVQPKSSDEHTLKDVVNFIKTKYPDKTGIIYYNNRQKCEIFARTLRDNYNIRAHHYHAEMSASEKAELQDQWQQGSVRLIVATVRRVGSSVLQMPLITRLLGCVRYGYR